jgi:hypothetical protein
VLLDLRNVKVFEGAAELAGGSPGGAGHEDE